MPISPENEIRVQLARMEGKQDVTNERLSNVQNDIVEMRAVQRDHSSRLGILEAKENIRSGERKGLTLGSKVMWSAVSLFAGGGGVFTIFEMLK